MTQYCMDPTTKKYVKGDGSLSFARNLCSKYKNQLLDTGLNALKTAFKNIVHKTDKQQACLELLTQQLMSCDNKTVKIKPVINENPRNPEEIVIPPEKRE